LNPIAAEKKEELSLPPLVGMCTYG
jgi:hypothetical protein